MEAEERGQGEAIARNLYEMSSLETPILSVLIGEGGSGSELYFEKNKRFCSTYDTPYGPMDIEVLTRSVDNHFDMETLSGIIAICYDVSLQGMAEGKNRIEIKVM